MSNFTGAVTEEEETTEAWFARRVAIALASRSRFGVLAVFSLAGVLLGITRSWRDNVLGSAALLVVLGGLSLARAVQARRVPEDPLPLRRWLLKFRIGALASAVLWGSTAAFVAARQLNADVLAVLIATAGVVAGATSSLCPDLPLARAYVTTMLLPIVFSVALGWGAEGFAVSLSCALFLVYSLVQCAHHHRSFFELLAQNRQFDAAVREAKHHAAEAARASSSKDEFLAYVGHELRMPLKSVVGYSKVLASAGGLDTEQRAALGVIERNAQHLLRSVNGLLDLSDVTSGKLELVFAPFSLAALLGEVRELLRSQAEARGLLLDVSVDSSTPAGLLGDALRLRQVMVNLIANAIEFTEQGGVRVTATVESQGGGALQLIVSVADTGIGMDREAQEALFVPFRRVGPNSTAPREGTGLGLAISKRLTHAMGGDITVSSWPGAGSTFRLTIPVTATPLAPQLAQGEVARVRAPSLGPVAMPIHSELSDDPDLCPLLPDYIIELRMRVGLLREALDGKQRQALFTEAHKLAGSAGSYGFPSITAAARSFEKVLKQEGPFEDVEREGVKLIALCARVELRAPAPTDPSPLEGKLRSA